MSDINETPMPTPSKAPNPIAVFWSSLSKNAKIAVVVIAVILFFAVIGGGSSSNTTTTQPTVTVPTTVSVSQQWSDWKSSFLPIVSATNADYLLTQADLGNYDEAASRSDFATLASDGTEWLAYANSPDETVNADVRAVAIDLQDISTYGISVLNGNDALAEFQKACQDFNADTTKLANDMESATASY